jgi:hypothetical protein
MTGTLESADAYGLSHALSLAVTAQLGHGVLDVKSDSPVAQTKNQRDLLGGLAFGRPPQHVALASRKLADLGGAPEALEGHHLLMEIEGDEQELANVSLLEPFPVGIGKIGVEGEDGEIALGAADGDRQPLFLDAVFIRLAEEAGGNGTERRQVPPI